MRRTLEHTRARSSPNSRRRFACLLYRTTRCSCLAQSFSSPALYIVRAGPTPAPGASREGFPADRKSSRLLPLIAPTAVAKLWGDDWGPALRFNKLLTQAGFEVLSTKFIGGMFIPAWDYAHERMERKPSLGMYGSPTKGWLTRFIIPEASLCGSVSL